MTKEEFINDNIVIKQGNNGVFYIATIACSVHGSVHGSVGIVDEDVGIVRGDVSNVIGIVHGNGVGDIDGDVHELTF